MPVFEIERGGKTYEVEAPDEGAAVSALSGIKDQPSAPATMSDLGKSLESGLAKGAASLGGMVGDLSDLGARGIHAATNWVERKVGMPESPAPDYSKSVANMVPTSKSLGDSIQRNFYNGEKPYEPQSKMGKFAHAAGELTPAILAGPGGMVAKATAIMGGGAGQVLGGDMAANSFGDRWRPYGEAGGAIAGSMTPSALARMITPIQTSPARQRLVGVLEGEGVTSLTAGQRTGNERLKYLEDALGKAPGSGGRTEQITREGQEQFTNAALRRAGAAGEATPEVLANNQRRLGQSFRDLSARNDLVPDNQFVTDIVAAARNYRRVPDSQQRAMVQGYIDDIVQHVNAGGMPGREYQEMRSRLSRTANSLRQSDPTLSEALRDMRNALDNAMERSISPADAAAWRQTRQQYGAQKDVEKAASRAGEATAEGQIVPANLRNVAAANNRGAYARGEGQFSELARAGAGVMAPLPNSGTAQRYNALQLFNQATMGAIPAVAGRALMSRPVQAYLANNAINFNNIPPAQLAAIRALLAQEKPQALSGPSN
jgi:hypothetical protein